MPTACALTIGAALLTANATSHGLTIAAHGKSAYQIVVPEGAGEAVSYAAQELQRFLGDVTGVRLPIASEERAKAGPAILLGPGDRVASTGLIDRARTLGDDGVLLKAVGDDLVLLGSNDRGQLYSVYVLLERFMGCRFLAPDCIVTPKRTVLVLPAIDYAYAPPFIYREELYAGALQWDYAARLKLNGSNMTMTAAPYADDNPERVAGIRFFPFVHSSRTLISPEEYGETHPEYFGLVGGERRIGDIGSQMCYTHPDVLRICTEKVLAWLEEHPEAASIDVSQNDAYPGSSGACECERCAAVVQEEGAQHGPIMRFVNAIAAIVAEKYPGRYVDTLAYDYTVPTPKVTKPLPNVIIRLCHQGCYLHGIDDEPLSANFRAAVDDWRAVAKNLFVWHYGVNFAHYLAPNPNLAALASDIKYYTAHGINGLMLQGNYNGGSGELSALRQYLAAQLMWDPTQDPMVIRADFCKGYYGPAKDEAWEFLSMMDDLAADPARHIGAGNWNPPDFTPPDFVARSLEVLERGRAKAGDPKIRSRIEMLMVPLWYCQLSWPEVYGVSKEQGRAILADFARAAEANNVVCLYEGPPSIDAFIARVSEAFGEGGG